MKITAAGVNFADVYVREGRYKSKLPMVIGQEAAGVVTEVGSEVTNIKPGDHVAYRGVQGSYAEYAAVPADKLVRIPQGPYRRASRGRDAAGHDRAISVLQHLSGKAR